MPTSRHSELERKFAAEEVTQLGFLVWCEKHHYIRHKDTKFPDVYYRRGSSVIRHRQSGGAGELTVKQRKSATDTTDRVEIDLRFDRQTTQADVTAFVAATGWEKELTLEKHFSEVYWFNHGGAEIAVSLYEVEDLASKKTCRMLEVEVEKESPINDATALNLLNLWCSVLAEDLHLGDPLHDSLYEIFSGKRYEIIRCGLNCQQKLGLTSLSCNDRCNLPSGHKMKCDCGN